MNLHTLFFSKCVQKKVTMVSTINIRSNACTSTEKNSPT